MEDSKSSCLPKFKLAFTLAEVLITLGVIGVVAALTMPSLINDIQDKQFKVAFKKQYSIVSQSLQKIIAEEGDFVIGPSRYFNGESIEGSKEMNLFACKIVNNLKVLKSGIDCSTGDINGTVSWHNRYGKYHWYNKKKEEQHLNLGYLDRSFFLVDGTLINFNCWNQVFIDVNGYKKPNTIGRDIFYFMLPINNTNHLYFFGSNPVNGCTSPYSVVITQETYEEDCKIGTGWGCSPMYILE